jgi:alkylation response protein AidB-like acyl-CoA dehydrogenase
MADCFSFGSGVKKGIAGERLYRHVRACRSFDGTGEMQKLIIARDMLREHKGGQGGQGPSRKSGG